LKGYYAIIPAEYAMWAIIPPTMFLDALAVGLGQKMGKKKIMKMFPK
jgi:hypothetical protein